MKKTLIGMLMTLFLVSCGPSVNPQLKAKIEPYFGASGTQSFGVAKKFFAPMPLAVGQYVVHGIIEKNGTRSVMRTAIVGREMGGWIFEYYNLTEKQEAVTQMLITGLDKVRKTGSIDDIEIVWVKIRDENGQVQKIEGPMMAMMRGLYKNNLAGLDTKTTAYVDGGVIKVPAGSFAGTNTFVTETSIMGRKYKSKGWFHSAVPINGMVKSVVDDGDSTMELLQFGLKGATPILR